MAGNGGEFQMKKRWIYGLLVLGLLFLSGCAAPAPEESATPAPEIVEVPEIEARGKLADLARKRMAVYEDQLSLIAGHYSGNFTYAIPGDIFAKMAKDAEETGAAEENGRYRFIWRQSGNYSYQSSGLKVMEGMEAEATPPPPDGIADAVMDNQKMGDFSASGGGAFDRSYAYDLAADLSQGRVEITDTLNGERTGHEIFSFIALGDTLYFVDAALDLVADLDELSSDGSYLIAVGKMERNSVEILEYTVSGEKEIPDAATLSWEQLIRSVRPLTHLKAKGNQITVSP